MFVGSSPEVFHRLWVKDGVEVSGEAEASRMGGTTGKYRVPMLRTKTYVSAGEQEILHKINCYWKISFQSGLSKSSVVWCFPWGSDCTIRWEFTLQTPSPHLKREKIGERRGFGRDCYVGNVEVIGHFEKRGFSTERKLCWMKLFLERMSRETST